jgi:hypothetical protein
MIVGYYVDVYQTLTVAFRQRLLLRLMVVELDYFGKN